jgi:uncharacterized cupin superfamily protein
MRPTSISILDPHAGPTVSHAGGTYRVVVSGEQTNQAYAVIYMLVPPHSGPGPHAHPTIQETFYILEGEVVVRSETQTHVAKKGAVVTIPLGGAVHNFTNEGTVPAYLLCVVAPAGLDSFFLAVGQPVVAGQPLTTQPPTSEQQQRIGELAKQYGQEVFPPDYFAKKG